MRRRAPADLRLEGAMRVGVDQDEQLGAAAGSYQELIVAITKAQLYR
jgi:hypothetical protein